MAPPVFEPHIEGPDNADTLFFIQGWPDDLSLWDAQVKALSGRYRCIRVNLPNYGDGPHDRWGYSHDDIVTALAQSVRRCSPSKQVTLVGHDWGAYWTYALHQAHPELVERIVGLDIAPHMKPTPREGLLIVAYQWWLVGAFLAGGRAGTWMTRRFARLFRAPQADEATADMNYPYFYVWRDIFTGRAAKRFAGYRPRVPVLFVYGTQKPGRFHSDRWLELVNSGPLNRVVALEGTGHWVTTNPKLTEILIDWLNRTAPH